jgi:hypothetical protein
MGSELTEKGDLIVILRVKLAVPEPNPVKNSDRAA